MSHNPLERQSRTRDAAVAITVPSAPIDVAEPVLAEPGVENADRSSALRPGPQVGKERIAAVSEVFDRDCMPALDAQRLRRVQADDIVTAPAVGGSDVGHKVFARGQIERGPVPEYHAQRKQGLRRQAIVVFELGSVRARGADRGVADTREARALKRDRIGQPPFSGGAER